MNEEEQRKMFTQNQNLKLILLVVGIVVGAVVLWGFIL